MSGIVMSTINGVQVVMRGGRVYVNGKLYGPVEGEPGPELVEDVSPKILQLDQDGVLKGPVEGGLTVEGSGVTLIVQGNITGNVRAHNVQVERITGNVRAEGNVTATKVVGNIKARSFS